MSSPVLLADIGGTNSRFALTDARGRPTHIHTIADEGVAGLEDALADYLQETQAKPGTAVLAVAALVSGPEIALTNRAWRFNLDDIKARFGISRIRAINDFEAQAWALPYLGRDDVQPIGRALEPATGVKLVLGPGTGLGIAALVPRDGNWMVVASEAGHVSFGPVSTDEEPVFARLRARGPVSAETVLSGPGLARLHAALHPQAKALAADLIARSAEAGEARAAATVRLFVRLLGRFAGDMALVFRATGGVYVSGGVALGLGPCFDAGVFRAAFEAHPPYAALLAKTATCRIVYEHPGLIGCAAVAATM